MKITTQDTFIDHQIIETLGIVKGNTIRARHIGKDILAGFRSIVGGEVSEYTKMLAESREQAIDRMIEEINNLIGIQDKLINQEIKKQEIDAKHQEDKVDLQL